MPACERTTLATSWHDGERAMQRRAGVAETLDGLAARIYRNHLTAPQQAFYARLTYVVAGSVDPEGDAWATLFEGGPGFLVAHGAFALEVRAGRDADDPADAGLGDGRAVGLLGIDLATRRRLRLNGHIQRSSDDRFVVSIEQSFGNCPQYIQARDAFFPDDARGHPFVATESMTMLDAPARALIRSADTFFVASFVDRACDERQIDVSHRGGLPGFVAIDGNGHLVIPDFPGNTFYNTLGNVLLNPKAGLWFADFPSGDVLQLTGDAYIDPDDGTATTGFEGVDLYWRFAPRRILRRRGLLRQRWTMPDDGWSPDSLRMGHWQA